MNWLVKWYLMQHPCILCHIHMVSIIVGVILSVLHCTPLVPICRICRSFTIFCIISNGGLHSLYIFAIKSVEMKCSRSPEGKHRDNLHPTKLTMPQCPITKRKLKHSTVPLMISFCSVWKIREVSENGGGFFSDNADKKRHTIFFCQTYSMLHGVLSDVCLSWKKKNLSFINVYQ